MSEDEARKIFKQIILGLEELHRNGISHRDLKMENILIGKGLKVKIIDFGFAVYDDNIHT